MFPELAAINSDGVGKSFLLLRFSDESFTTSFITTIGYVCFVQSHLHFVYILCHVEITLVKLLLKLLLRM
ncbi:hypothetical protein RIF29_30063 [Crotalaria pallida]|uniref:Uncharacterized protein n=1 Tax=Crotalaria pallida TaxID=3830 RepID=A0AAN9EGH6_CROPI